MGWKSVVRELVKARLPTVVLPALVVGLIIYCFGFTLESLVAVLVFHPALRSLGRGGCSIEANLSSHA